METPEERKRRLARQRQQRRRMRLQGSKLIWLRRCLCCGREFLAHQTQGRPKTFCSRRCIDRSRYLSDKVLSSREGRMLMVLRLHKGIASEQDRRLFGFLCPEALLAGEAGQREFGDWLAAWLNCDDLSEEDRRERMRELWAQERGIWH